MNMGDLFIIIMDSLGSIVGILIGMAYVGNMIMKRRQKKEKNG